MGRFRTFIVDSFIAIGTEQGIRIMESHPSQERVEHLLILVERSLGLPPPYSDVSNNRDLLERALGLLQQR